MAGNFVVCRTYRGHPVDYHAIRPKHDADTSSSGSSRARTSPTTPRAASSRPCWTSGEARRGFRKLAVTHAGGKRWVLVGLGERDEFDAERARVAAGGRLRPRGRARRADAVLGGPPPRRRRRRRRAWSRARCWRAYRFDRYKSGPRRGRAGSSALLVCAHHDVAEPVARAVVVGRGARTPRATCRTRPANDMTPTALADAPASWPTSSTGSRSRSRAATAIEAPRHGRVRRRGPGQPRGARADRAALRAGRRCPARGSGSSARR